MHPDSQIFEVTPNRPPSVKELLQTHRYNLTDEEITRALKIVAFQESTPLDRAVEKAARVIVDLRPGIIHPVDAPQQHADQQFDEPTLSDEEMLSTYEKAVHTTLKHFSRRFDVGSELEDLAQILRMRLITIPVDKRAPDGSLVRTNAAIVKSILVREAIDFSRDHKSASKKLSYGEGEAIQKAAHQPIETVESDMAAESMLSPLSISQRKVVTLHLGLNGDQPVRSMRTIGKMLGISEKEAKHHYELAVTIMKRKTVKEPEA